MKKFWIIIFISILFKSCVNMPQKTINEGLKKEPVLKYPVILVHGIVAHDRKSVIDFWGRIPGVLRKNGIKVYPGNTDSWGSFESNAEILKNTIDKVLQETGCEKVNIIAHSKGGLDSRYFIWKYGYGRKVASLTTVSTPHHGAELADLIFRHKVVHTKNMRNILNIFGAWYGDINPDMYNVNFLLTKEEMKKFNDEVVPDENVYYRSVYSVMNNAFDDLVFFYSYLYIEKAGGPNDGVVSEASAKWGDNVLRIENISHAEIVDYKKRRISGIDIPDIYLDIAQDLRKRGF